jgi:hypothetical protein
LKVRDQESEISGGTKDSLADWNLKKKGAKSLTRLRQEIVPALCARGSGTQIIHEAGIHDFSSFISQIICPVIWDHSSH